MKAVLKLDQHDIREFAFCIYCHFTSKISSRVRKYFVYPEHCQPGYVKGQCKHAVLHFFGNTELLPTV